MSEVWILNNLFEHFKNYRGIKYTSRYLEREVTTQLSELLASGY